MKIFYETAKVRCIAIKEGGGILSCLCRNLGLTVRRWYIFWIGILYV